MSLLLTVPEAQAVVEADRLCNDAFNEFSDDQTLTIWTKIVGDAHARIKEFHPDHIPLIQGKPWPSIAWESTRRTTSWCCGSPVYEVQAKLVLEEGQLPSENYKHERRWVPAIVILCPCGKQMFGEEYVSPNGISMPCRHDAATASKSGEAYVPLSWHPKQPSSKHATPKIRKRTASKRRQR